MGQRKCYICILITGCLWGTIGTFVKLLENAGSTSVYTAFLRMFFGSIFLLIFCIAKEGAKALRIHRRTLVSCIAIAVFSQGIYNLAYNSAISIIGVSYTAILYNSAPLFTALLSVLVLKESIGQRKIIGILANVAGCILTVIGGSMSGGNIVLIGVIYALITALGYAVCPILAKLSDSRDSSVAIAVYCAFFTWIFLLLLRPLKGVPEPFDLKLIAIGFAYALCTTGIADILWYTGIKNINDSSKVPVLASVNLPVSTLCGTVLFNERYGLLSIVGMALVMLSIFIINRKDRDNV